MNPATEIEYWVCLHCGRQFVREKHSDGDLRCCTRESASVAIYHSKADANKASNNIRQSDS